MEGSNKDEKCLVKIQETSNNNDPNVHTEQEEKNFEDFVKNELAKLNRQYQLMLSNRNHNLTESSLANLERKQKRLITLYLSERDNLISDLDNVTSSHFKRKDKSNKDNLINLLYNYNHQLVKIQEQILLIREIGSQMDKIAHKVIQQKLKVLALFGQSMTPSQAQKRLDTLENRLHQMTVQYDSKALQNAAIREDINNFLLERKKFHTRFINLKNLIVLAKEKLAELTQLATETYDSRDESASKIKAMQERNDRESKQHLLEMKEYLRVLHYDESNNIFMAVKNKERVPIEKDGERLVRRTEGKLRNLEETLIKYKSSFKEVVNISKASDIDKIISAYKIQQTKNHANFLYSGRLSHEIDVISLRIKVFQVDIEIAASQMRKKDEDDETLIKIAEQYETTERELDEAIRELELNEDAISNLTKIVEHLFIIAKCEKSSFIKLLDKEDSGVQQKNICLYLKILEYRISQLIREKKILELRKATEIDGGKLPGKQLWTAASNIVDADLNSSGGPFNPKIIISGRFDETEVGEEEQEEDEEDARTQPLSYLEVKEIIHHKLSISGGTSTAAQNIKQKASLIKIKDMMK